MNAQEVQITLDFRPDVEQLKALEAFSHTPLGQDVMVRKNLVLASTAVLSAISLRAERQADLVRAMVVPGLSKLLQDNGSGVGKP